MKAPVKKRSSANDPDQSPVDLCDLPDEELWSMLPDMVGPYEQRDRLEFGVTVRQVRSWFSHGMVSKDLGEVHHAINECLWNSSSVLITGETGTGKEVVARCIHNLGKRKVGPFKAINCSGIPAELLDSEIFGHEPGAFTGALRKGKVGWVESADRGTLFLDEVGDMPGPLQAKLLRFLNDGTFTRVGGTEEKKVDVRIISATSRDMGKLLSGHQFRADLYYRLNTMEIAVEPLRDRLTDIPILLYHFVTQFNKEIPKGRRVHKVSLEVIEEASFYGWPGNIRQLRSLVERGINISGGTALAYRKQDRSVIRPGLYRIFTEEEEVARWERATRVLTTLGLDSRVRRSLPGKEGKRATFLRGTIALPSLLRFSMGRFLSRSDTFVLPEDRGLWRRQTRSAGSSAGAVRGPSAGSDDGGPSRAELNVGPDAAFEAEDPPESILDLKAHEVHRIYATRLLEKHNGNASSAARVAGVDAKTIKRWAVGKEK